MAIKDKSGYVKQAVTGLLALMVVQEIVLTASKFLSLKGVIYATDV